MSACLAAHARYRGGERIQGGFRGAVELQHVRFCYPTKAKKSALRGVTLNVAAGQTIGLVGPGGSGKSTLLALVQCLYPPLVGTVLFDGQNVRHLDQRWLRRHIAFVPRVRGQLVVCAGMFLSGIESCVFVSVSPYAAPNHAHRHHRVQSASRCCTL